ncbi:hypothetical protein YC2023_094411 [Brassica napus]
MSIKCRVTLDCIHRVYWFDDGSKLDIKKYNGNKKQNGENKTKTKHPHDLDNTIEQLFGRIRLQGAKRQRPAQKMGVRSSRSTTVSPPGHHTSRKSTSTRTQSAGALSSSAGMTGSSIWKHETLLNRMTQRIRESRHGQSLRTRETDRQERITDQIEE